MDKHRTENVTSDDAELYISDIRSYVSKPEDTGYKPTIKDLRECVLNKWQQEANKRSQKNAEHDAKYGDASDGESSRLPKHQMPEDAHVPQG